MHRITPGRSWPLHDNAQTRQIEALASQGLAPHTLMQRAGLASARLALALAPHARVFWIACGPGNNGGDGLEAAMHLQHWGKPAMVTLFGDHTALPADATVALQRARDAGVGFVESPPPLTAQDLSIDAVLGLGQRRALTPSLTQASDWLNTGGAPVLALDLPTGVCADTGRDLNAPGGLHPPAGCTVRAAHTLSLLTLKPGLFTAEGRGHAGQVWFDDLGVSCSSVAHHARLIAAPLRTAAPHSAHKGNRGAAWIVGGAPGMRGAVRLAARAALHAGVGKVHVRWIEPCSDPDDPHQPEILYPRSESLLQPAMAVLCGCGAGPAVAAVLPALLAHPGPLVLDADALNAVARDSSLHALLCARGRRHRATVLTPHPLETARLLDQSVTQVQADRSAAAVRLAQTFGAVIVLKGSGTLVANAEGDLWINPTGNGRLAQAGTGDVLAGMLAAELALGLPPTEAACAAVYRHGAAADAAPVVPTLTASRLALAQG